MFGFKANNKKEESTANNLLLRSRLFELYTKIKHMIGVYEFTNYSLSCKDLYNIITKRLNKDQALEYTKRETKILVVENDFEYYNSECDNEEYTLSKVHDGTVFCSFYKTLDNGDLVMRLISENDKELVEFSRRLEAGDWKIVTSYIPCEYKLSKDEQELLCETKKMLENQ